MTCESCNSCQGCVNCQVCVRCQLCVYGNLNGESGCIDCQAFCQSNQYVSRTFSFGQCVSSGQTFKGFKTGWDSLYRNVINAYNRGREVTFSDSPYKPSSIDNEKIMTANAFNLIAEALCNLGEQSVTIPSVTTGDVIEGSLFETLELAAQNFKYDSSQCNKCNVGCDVTCDSCQLCDAGCMSSETPSPSTECTPPPEPSGGDGGGN